jgi:predicted DNA binding CopG/RHH family protein
MPESKKMGKAKRTDQFLDDEERELIESYEAAIDDGRVVMPSVEVQLETAAKWQAITRDTSERKPLTLRIQSGDISRIKAIALRKGLPYQTLVASVLHQYAHGDLIERPLNLKPAGE